MWNVAQRVAKAGVLIDVCDRCLGVWLERGELEPELNGRVRTSMSREPAWHGDDDDRRPQRRRRWSEIFDIFD